MRPPADTPIDASDVPRAQSIQAFQGLMPFRVREVLLVGSRYDTFMLKEEGQITDLFLQEYDRLNHEQEARGFFDIDRRIETTLQNLGLDEKTWNRRIGEF